jgi:YesN/AraC family two-component response regulator
MQETALGVPAWVTPMNHTSRDSVRFPGVAFYWHRYCSKSCYKKTWIGGVVEGKPRVLVVDDEPANRELLRRVNNYFAFETVEAEDGEDGWALYQKVKPALTISDIYMPKMNGVQLLASIKKHDKTAKVILITGYARFRAMLETCPYQPDGFLQKPFDIEKLGRLMRALLSEFKLDQEAQDRNQSNDKIGPPRAIPESPLPVEELEHDD